MTPGRPESQLPEVHQLIKTRLNSSAFKNNRIPPKFGSTGCHHILPYEFGKTPLHVAIEAKDFSKIKFLLQNGLDQTLLSTDGLSPFHMAAMNPNINIFELFSMTDIDHRTMSGQTALHLAIEAGNILTVDTLLRNGADVNVVDENGESPLFIAARIGSDAILEKLVDHGAELDIRNFLGQSLASLITVDLFEELSSRQCVSVFCSENEICKKSNEEYVCECKTGFFRDQTQCVDMDECLVENCLENSICQNIPGSFSCLCLPGYEKTLNGSCENVNECLTSPCNDVNSYCVDNRVVI